MGMKRAKIDEFLQNTKVNNNYYYKLFDMSIWDLWLSDESYYMISSWAICYLKNKNGSLIEY